MPGWQDARAANASAVARLIEAAAETTVRRVVHCSTVGVHGDVEHPPADEDAPLRPHALERIVGVFEGSAQRQIVLQLSNALQGIIAQELLPAADRTRRVLAYELVVANGAVRNMIRENQLHQIENTIQTGRKEGMMLMDNCLHDLYCRALITYETAVSRARHPDRIIPQKV